jgi:hypothetical protein
MHTPRPFGAGRGGVPQEDRLTVKQVLDQSAANPVAHEPSAARADAPSAPGPLMLLVAALFAGSALTSLTLLWFAFRGIGWLLLPR